MAKATKNFSKIRNAIQREWYVQGINAVPLYVMNCGKSTMSMKRPLGISYRWILYYFQHGYGEMHYDPEDFQKLWQEVKGRLKKDAAYLIKIRALYEQRVRATEDHFAQLSSHQLRSCSEYDLLIHFHRGLRGLDDAVGVAHIIEPIGQEIEKEFKQELFAATGNTETFREYWSLLTTPVVPSFLSQEEQELSRLRRYNANRQKPALQAHVKKWGWIRNTYVSPVRLTVRDFRRRLADAKRVQSVRERDIVAAAQRLHLPARVQRTAALIRWVTTWQDERKAHILRAIGNAGRATHEVCRRLHLRPQALDYSLPQEAHATRSLVDLRKLARKCSNRGAGMFSLMESRGEIHVSGRQFRVLERFRKGAAANITSSHPSELHGSTANGGTVIGPARVCIRIADLKKVRPGDVLVTTMTRPEFVPAIKKASAIVTDEGGITSHAAIVAREFKIPAVIGTKVATRRLRDGSLVEVKANHGVVKILEY